MSKHLVLPSGEQTKACVLLYIIIIALTAIPGIPLAVNIHSISEKLVKSKVLEKQMKTNNAGYCLCFSLSTAQWNARTWDVVELCSLYLFWFLGRSTSLTGLILPENNFLCILAALGDKLIPQ